MTGYGRNETNERTFVFKNELSFYIKSHFENETGLGKAPMPKVSDAHLEARRQQILDASSACFGRQGFHQTTMQDICQKAGLSPGAVYRYFSSKEEIIAASCQACQQGIVDFIQAGTAGGNNAIEMLDQLFEAGFGYLANPEAAESFQMSIQLWAEAQRSPKIKDVYRESCQNTMQESFASILVQGQQSGEIDPELDGESMARILLSSWQGLLVQKSLDPGIDVMSYASTLKLVYHRAFSSVASDSTQ